MPLDLTEVETTLQASNADLASETTLSDVLSAVQGTKGVSLETNNSGTLSTKIDADNAGLASQTTLSSVLSQLQGTLSIKVDGDTVGLASETTLSDVLSAVQGTKGVSLQANNAGTLSIKIDADNAGLASQSTLSSVLSELQSTLTVTDDGDFSASVNDGTAYPSQTIVGADLSAGNLTIGPLPAPQTQALLIALNPTGGGSYSVTVDWQDANGNVFQTQTASDLSISGATTDQNARLFRKGPEALITVSGTDTALNAFVGTHR